MSRQFYIAQSPHRRITGWLLFLVVVAGGLSGGCAQVRVSDPPRTATEQFLLSEAASKAVAQLSTSALRDRRVYVDTTYFEATDEPYVIGELRAHLLINGVRLMEKREDAQIILEARTRGVGIDRYDYLFGIPPVLIPATDVGSLGIEGGTLITPEIAISKNLKQWGYASVAFVAYWSDTGEVVTASGPFVGTTRREDYWFMGAGPNSLGDVPTVEEQQE